MIYESTILSTLPGAGWLDLQFVLLTSFSVKKIGIFPEFTPQINLHNKIETCICSYTD